MKKILLINSSLRKKSTYKLLTEIEGLLTDYSTEIVNLGDFDIKPCVGCENCIVRDKCPIKDDSSIIMNKMIEADGIIIGSPVYLRNISGLLKVFIDRGCSWYHRSPLIGKPVFFVTTTASSGSKQTINYLKDLSLQWGTIYSGYISRNAVNIDKKKIHIKEFKKFINFMNRDKLASYIPSFKEIIEFNTQKILATKIIPKDFEYWQNMGYMDSKFFFKCKINPFKKLIGFIYYKLLMSVIPDRKSNFL